LKYIKFVLDMTAPGDDLRKELLAEFLTAYPDLTREEWRQAFTWTASADGTHRYVVQHVSIQGKMVPILVKHYVGAERSAQNPEAATIAGPTFTPTMSGTCPRTFSPGSPACPKNTRSINVVSTCPSTKADVLKIFW